MTSWTGVSFPARHEIVSGHRAKKINIKGTSNDQDEKGLSTSHQVQNASSGEKDLGNKTKELWNLSSYVA